jgi:hypothetical protein
MPPTYNAMKGRMRSRASSMSSPTNTCTVGAIATSSRVLPPAARSTPICSSSRMTLTCSGEKSVGMTPSAISAVSCVFFGPIAAM